MSANFDNRFGVFSSFIKTFVVGVEEYLGAILDTSE